MELHIANTIINQQSSPYIIAEAGVHHDNSVELAKQYILQAKIAGANAIKFQTYSAKRLAAKWAPTYWDDPSGKTQYDIFAERSLLSQKDYGELFTYAEKVDITFLSTPFDPDSAALLSEFDMPAYKIASADLTYYPLLEAVAAFEKPILLSTGAATFSEIQGAVDFLTELNAEFSLLHCVLSYPTSIKDANLHRITRLKNLFPNIILGYSDHTQPQDSTLACPIATALGARIIEKHFTLNKNLDGDDHYHAVDSHGLAQLVRNCKDADIMTAFSEEMKESEFPARTYARRSIVAARDLKAGSLLTINDVDFKRPGTGLPPTVVKKIIGKTLNQGLNIDDLIQFEYLDDGV